MKKWKIGIVKDTSKPMLGLHGLQNAFRGLPNVEVAAHVDSNPENIEQKMLYTGAKKHYLSYLEMLDREKPDIAVLCSRHPYDHFKQIEAAAERGINIYCEKPMTVNLEEADAIIELSEKHHIKICMAHPARYALPFRTMKAMIETGEIGTPLTVYGRGKCDHRGGGEDLIVLGTHILDLQTFFFSAPEYVWADVTADGMPIVKTDRTKTIEPLGPVAGDNIYAAFRFPHGVHGVFETRKGLYDYEHGINNMGISVAGTAGTLAMLFDDRGDRRLRISRRPSQPDGTDRFEDVSLREDRLVPGAVPLDYSISGQPDIPCVPLFLESNRFAVWDLMLAIQEDRLPLSNQYNARLTQEMVYGIYASHLSRRAINFPLTDRKHPLEG
ncbi:MAG: Gfo/Idh/MocA family oxidoreductase [Victivallales bacterium]